MHSKLLGVELADGSNDECALTQGRLSDNGGARLSDDSECNVACLRQNFVPAQRTRRDTVVAAATGATARMDEARAQITKAIPQFVDSKPGGLRVYDPANRRISVLADCSIRL